MEFYLPLIPIIAVIVAVVAILYLVLQLTKLSDGYWVLWCWHKLWYRRTHLVRIMDYANEVRFTLVTPQPDGTLAGHVYWGTSTTPITLVPEGVQVNPAASYIYAWEHVDKDLHVQHMLTYDDYKGIEWWCKLDHQEKMHARDRVMHGC
jgi:hypothetical protein